MFDDLVGPHQVFIFISLCEHEPKPSQDVLYSIQGVNFFTRRGTCHLCNLLFVSKIHVSLQWCLSWCFIVMSFEVLEGTEYTAAWCSVDNWQPLTCDVYFNGELEKSEQQQETSSIGRSSTYRKFYINYLIRITDCGPYTLSRILHKTPPSLKTSAVKW